MKNLLRTSKGNLVKIITIVLITISTIHTYALNMSSIAPGGPWNTASSWAPVTRSGTIVATLLAPTTVTGVGTSFTTQLAPGSIIYTILGLLGTVASIESNTSLTLTAPILVGLGPLAYTAQIVPLAGDNVTIVSGSAVSLTTTATVNDIIVDNGGNLTITGKMSIGGLITRTGTGVFDVSNGTLEMLGPSASQIPANGLTGNKIKNLIASAHVFLLGPLDLTGTLSFGNVNNKKVTSGGFLTFISNAAGTARVADLTNGGINSGNEVFSQVTLQRYIPPRRAWRLLAGNILSGLNIPTINEAWQEGATTASAIPNPNPGYGTHITGGPVGKGFDQNALNNPSLKVYLPATDTLIGLPATLGTTGTLINAYPAYYLFVRGDRGNNLALGTAAPTSPTVLRIKGDIIKDDYIVTVNATNYTIVANPYPSAVNFGSLTRTNVNNRLYQWDPKMSGTYGVGAYVTVSYNAATGMYDATSSISPINQYVQSGEAFFVKSTGVAGTLKFKETDKTALGSDFVFRTAGLEQKVRIDLYEVNADSTVNLLDGVLATFNDINSNAVDDEDATKMKNIGENVGILRDAATLSIERRKTIISADTLFLKTYQMKLKNYRLKIEIVNMDHPAVLKDNYTSNVTSLNLNGISEIDFNVNNDAGSYASDRFSIVFGQSVVPVFFKSVNAYQVQKDIAVNWAVENELNIVDYEVQGSQNGMDFSKKANIPATGNNGSSVNYLWTDVNPIEGLNFYRIAATENSGTKLYSAIVKVNSIQNSGIPEVVIYPNPIKDNKIALQLKNIENGSYTLNIYNMQGQRVKQQTLVHDGITGTYTISIDKKLPAGKYQVQLSGNTANYNIALIKD